MEKSIESIWKEGFLNKDALVIPKLNDLYNRKSISVVDKYKRMFKKNIIIIFVAAFVQLIVNLLIGMPYLGVPMFFMLIAMAIVDLRLSKGLNKIDNKTTCYQYLKTLNNWMIHKTRVNIIMARILYPYTFISLVFGYWYFYIEIEESTLGDMIMNRLLQVYPEMPLIFGFPVYGIIGLMIIAGYLIYMAERIYKWDLNLVYGNVLKKLSELMSDMEELRN
jgi:hypothetical protein